MSAGPLPLDSGEQWAFGDEPVVVGIDEAGRGPVLGPMTLREDKREALFKKVRETAELGWVTRVLGPEELSAEMLRRSRVNLNVLSHDAASSMVQRLLARGLRVERVYVDTVGDAGRYRALLSRRFPGIDFTVEPKADANYAVVSAASICAKVTRDTLMRDWRFAESGCGASTAFGSGYPSDPTTQRWLRESVDEVFGFPSVMRFSWKTCDALLDKSACPVDWGDDEDDDPTQGRLPTSSGPERYRFFSDNGLQHVDDF
eukprot:m51a1_g7889 putative ribonuclease h2 subunit a-like (259) ;mRNA; f:76982-78173